MYPLRPGGVLQADQPTVRPKPAERTLSDAGQILARLGGQCAAEYKYGGVRVQAHRAAGGAIELFTRRLERVSAQFPNVVEALAAGLRRLAFVRAAALLPPSATR
jgi:ATP-dependent DNA ligase